MSSSICAEHHHHHHHHPLFTTKKLHPQAELNNLPPRKLLTRRSNLIPISISSFDHDFTDENPLLTPELSPNFPHKFLPFNNPNDEDDDEQTEDPYSTDDFRIYEFKVRRCMRSRSHDWTDCPFAHPGEKARRRDPRRFHYSGNACSDFRRGNCPRGDSCEFAHGVFECWLHPARYRTQACKDGKACKRKVCFFAHIPKQLRILPQSQSPPPPDHNQFSLSKTKNTHNCCCVHCHSSSSSSSPCSVISSSSPTSTLMGFSHLSSSPPLSPSPSTTITSELTSKQQQSLLGMLSYKNKLMELVNSLEAMDLNVVNSPTHSLNNENIYFTWGSGGGVNSPNYEHPQQFVLSPDSNTTTGQASTSWLNTKDFFFEEYGLNNNGGSSSSCPDLEWVNELVM